jgi:uncharacterized protein (DUF2126 family)
VRGEDMDAGRQEKDANAGEEQGTHGVKMQVREAGSEWEMAGLKVHIRKTIRYVDNVYHIE